MLERRESSRFLYVAARQHLCSGARTRLKSYFLKSGICVNFYAVILVEATWVNCVYYTMFKCGTYD